MSKLGFGIMRLPMTDPNDEKTVDIEKTQEMIDAYMESGFNYFDTAFIYHRGMSEKILGQLLVDRYPRDSYILTDKMPTFMVKKPEDYDSLFAKQLDRTHVDYFDYYFFHSLGRVSYEQMTEFGGFEWMKNLKASGKCRHLGFSYHDGAETLDRILSEHPEFEVVQLQLNYFDWDDEGVQAKDCYDVCCKHGVKVIVMEPLKGGTLVNLPDEALDILKKVSPQDSIASWGIRFAGGLENVMMVLSGMSNMEQLKDNINTMKNFKALSDDESKAIAEVVDILKKKIDIRCTACRYCTQGCPMEIRIPEYFALYNNCRIFGFTENIYSVYENIIGGRPEECIGCGQCESVCPQHIQIIENIKKVGDFFAATR